MVVGCNGDGKEITSCVLEPQTALPRPLAKRATVNANHRMALQVLQRIGAASTGEWRKATGTEMKRKIADNTFEKWRKVIVAEGLAVAEDGSRPARYRITDTGSSAIGAPTNAIGVESTSVSHATTPVGVAGRAGLAEGDRNAA